MSDSDEHIIKIRGEQHRIGPVKYAPECPCGWFGGWWSTKSLATERAFVHAELMRLKRLGYSQEQAYALLEELTSGSPQMT